MGRLQKYTTEFCIGGRQIACRPLMMARLSLMVACQPLKVVCPPLMTGLLFVVAGQSSHQWLAGSLPATCAKSSSVLLKQNRVGLEVENSASV